MYKKCYINEADNVTNNGNMKIFWTPHPNSWALYKL